MSPTSTTSKGFTVTGDAPVIVPGQTKTYLVTVKNDTAQALHILTMDGSAVAVSGCDTSKIVILHYDSKTAGAVQYYLKDKATVTMPMTISFLNTPTNQDGCKGKKISLSYSGTAEQWQ